LNSDLFGISALVIEVRSVSITVFYNTGAVNCPFCSAAAPPQSRFCGSCGASLVPDAETRLVQAVGTPRLTATAMLTPAPAIDHGRFPPGTALAERYRIIGRAGRGGMGEIYRADDLRLGQPVALKFLPDQVERDATRLAQFHAEVRLARQVSHPNVCRVYDLDEADGHTFISMEYIDGEDLASLLRRIGRLPQDKALELARQMCAGLAAAHERGVLHRDLKPSNLMIDGEGRLRIADFGIAALAESGGASAGTPGYMAPELLSGGSASVRSDIYALGLVLYELFTGRRAYAYGSLAELVRAQQETQPTAPTAHVRDLDPAIERTILRCLQPDPERRPGTALAVAAMLPGGDPLAAALAAGETPSPEMLAAAGEAEALAPSRAIPLVLVAIAMLAAIVPLSERTSVTGLVPLPRHAAVLADRATEIARSLGYATGSYRAQGFTTSVDYIQHIDRRDTSAGRWAQLSDARGPTTLYWFRASPRMIVPVGVNPRPGLHDPPMNISGQVGIILDPSGRLVELHGVPPQFDEQTTPARAPDWAPLFRAAALEPSRFSPAVPNWTPRQFADARAAWTGTVVEHPDIALRVEAAAYRGQPVFFALAWPWTEPTRMVERPRGRAELVLGAVGRIFVLLVLAGAVLLAWRNARRGRGDRQGAIYIATLAFGLSLAARFLRMAHVADPRIESERFFLYAVGGALFNAALMWVMYLALEPAVRRYWPDTLLGWSRLVSGRLRDPRVGRDLLYGAVAGLVIAAFGLTHDVLPPLFGQPQPVPNARNVGMLIGLPVALGDMLFLVNNSLQNAGLALFLLVVLRMLFRSRILTAVVAVASFVLLDSAQFAQTATPLLDLAFGVALVVMLVTGIVRLGLLASIVMFSCYQLVNTVPLTLDLTAWHARPTVVALLLTLLPVFGGFYLARAGAPLFGRAFLEE
jgi:serine/threonine-protein kinase